MIWPNRSAARFGKVGFASRPVVGRVAAGLVGLAGVAALALAFMPAPAPPVVARLEAPQDIAYPDAPTAPAMLKVASLSPVLLGGKNGAAALTDLDVFLLKEKIDSCLAPYQSEQSQPITVVFLLTLSLSGLVLALKSDDGSHLGQEQDHHAAAESARRALLHPDCNPLPAPPGKYGLWRTLLVVFQTHPWGPPPPLPPVTRKAEDFDLQRWALGGLTPSPRPRASAVQAAPPTPTPVAEPNPYKLSEEDIEKIRATIEPCWNFDPGVHNSGDLTVELRLFMNPDGAVRGTEFVDPVRYHAGDRHYKAAADSARRAVMNPKCNRLPLLREFYQYWSTIIMNFDPVRQAR